MATRTPQQAAQEFFEPLQRALGCIARAKITTSAGGKGVPDTSHVWTINNDEGAQLDRDLYLVGRMRYKIVQASARRWRVTTEMYQYAYRTSSTEIVGWHWHPSGNSHYTLPHFHVGMAVPLDSGVLTPRSHIRTPRTAFEEVIATGLSELNIEPQSADWQSTLDTCLGIFEMNRTWSETPDKRAARPWWDS
jgi:hypothetical protein